MGDPGSDLATLASRRDRTVIPARGVLRL